MKTCERLVKIETDIQYIKRMMYVLIVALLGNGGVRLLM